jgi:hypothetical protein
MVKMYLVNFLLMTFVGTKSSHGIFDVAQSYTIVFLAIIWVRVSTISLTTQCVSLVVDTLVCQAQLQGLKTKETYVNLSVDRTTSLPPETRLMQCLVPCTLNTHATCIRAGSNLGAGNTRSLKHLGRRNSFVAFRK